MTVAFMFPGQGSQSIGMLAQLAAQLTRQLLTFTPQNCWEKPPVIDSTDDPDRQEEALLDVMPDDPKFTYDIHEIIDLIVDNGEFFEIKEDFAPNMVVGFARFDDLAASPVSEAAKRRESVYGFGALDDSEEMDEGSHVTHEDSPQGSVDGLDTSCVESMTMPRFRVSR